MAAVRTVFRRVQVAFLVGFQVFPIRGGSSIYYLRRVNNCLAGM